MPAPRSPAGILFASAPIVLVLGLVGATASLALLSWMGGTASGDRVTLSWSGECIEDAAPQILARAQTVGLGEPVGELLDGRYQLTATLPGDPGIDPGISGLLTQQGLLTLNGAPPEIEQALLTMDERGMPYVRLRMGPQDAIVLKSKAPDKITARLDGMAAAVWFSETTLEDRQLRLLPIEGDGRAQMRDATDKSVVLSHPHPCEITLAHTGSSDASPPLR